ncbi:hypothetical protein SELMODRAFT_430361 [Selaginella moellendorffii]|uniref:Uncharacterized protein n=1 Tax=Selaginella moellendorffii TaxID=88036 RepID=D8T962_SELML|nr:hypothetical protein SELMODRAFT_430361 [Selaginella moellendorffii]
MTALEVFETCRLPTSLETLEEGPRISYGAQPLNHIHSSVTDPTKHAPTNWDPGKAARSAFPTKAVKSPVRRVSQHESSLVSALAETLGLIKNPASSLDPLAAYALFGHLSHVRRVLAERPDEPRRKPHAGWICKCHVNTWKYRCDPCTRCPRYLEETQPAESSWQGECFMFDRRSLNLVCFLVLVMLCSLPLKATACESPPATDHPTKQAPPFWTWKEGPVEKKLLESLHMTRIYDRAVCPGILHDLLHEIRKLWQMPPEVSSFSTPAAVPGFLLSAVTWNVVLSEKCWHHSACWMPWNCCLTKCHMQHMPKKRRDKSVVDGCCSSKCLLQREQPVAEVPGKEKLHGISRSGPPVTGLARRTYVIFRDLLVLAQPILLSAAAVQRELMQAPPSRPSDYACSWSWHKRCKVWAPDLNLGCQRRIESGFQSGEAHLTFQLQNWHRLSFSTNLDEREGVEKGCRVSRSESLKTIRQLMDKLSFYGLLVIYFLMVLILITMKWITSMKDLSRRMDIYYS